MISIGEETGSLDTMLGSIADYYLSELEERLDGLTAAIEPIVTIVIGICLLYTSPSPRDS